MKYLRMLLIPILIIAVFWACYESPEVALHQPGIYKGATDPLLAKQRTDNQKQILRKRFKQIQVDR